MQFLIAVSTTLIILGFMILIHELGHHLVAKAFGVRVDVFSIGFGKRLFGFQWGETDYRLSALPFGGYVKMAGMDAVESRVEIRSNDPGEFMNHPRWQRVLIGLAGPAVNIAFAVALLTGVYMVDYDHPAFLDGPAEIGAVQPDTPGARAGLKEGDVIIRVDDKQNPKWEDVYIKAVLSPNQPLSIAVQRGTEIVSTSITPKPTAEDPGIGLLPKQRFLIAELRDDLPAQRAGLRPGDELIAIDGQPLKATSDLPEYLEKHHPKTIALQVLRKGGLQTIKVDPVEVQEDGRKMLRIGISVSMMMHSDKLAFTDALQRSLHDNKRDSLLILTVLRKLIEQKVSIKQMDGPIGIGKHAGEFAQMAGWTPILKFVVMISLNLGVFNLLPIPILDGGLILLTTIEGLMRRDIDQRIKERIYQTAFVFLVIFMIVVMYNDVTKYLT